MTLINSDGVIKGGEPLLWLLNRCRCHGPRLVSALRVELIDTISGFLRTPALQGYTNGWRDYTPFR